ncbi:glutathione S-transferase family protein [Neoroseomonas oryzicola]|uniref:Glutathione S-transferase family protein n=1 Tax=Neoroseomonas oryzicola TaxID=535904 RepID=A0A9X9WL88_9PROT|nr:glutathione S-transferase family protein [Neoroseomonas oryzicola]MBR0661098.1 glutathione S-transferase family protein [Neoroseomonas oryzicola]NKE17426.1 glutathione S-transferase family protein [Neoroseomonas oryzicola]
MARQLFELCGSDPARVFSPFCWRARMALAHKGLDFESVPWRFTETDRLAFAGHDKVPVLVDGERTVPDSWAIAQYLDEAYPEAPSLLHGAPAPYLFVAAWNDTVLQAGLVRLIVSDIPPLLGEERAYFIESREKRFGMPLAEVTADREARLPAFRATLQPLRQALKGRDFLGGAAPDYADFIVFGGFMWARSVSPLRVLELDDTLCAWRERMLDLHGGMARRAPCFGA